MMKKYYITVLILTSLVFTSNCYSQEATLIYNIYSKPIDFLYRNDSIIYRKVHIRENGCYNFVDLNDAEGDEQLIRFFKKRTVRIIEPVVPMLYDSIEMVKDCFPNGMSPHLDSFPDYSLEYSYPLHLFSEPPLNEIPDDDVIRITYVNMHMWDKKTYGKPADYHFIEITFRNDSAIMHYKEGKFVKGVFDCYEENRIVLKNREVKDILKSDREINWEKEHIDCDGDFLERFGVIERKKNGSTVSIIRNAYCGTLVNWEQRPIYSTVSGFIVTVRNTRDKYLRNKIRDGFPF